MMSHSVWSGTKRLINIPSVYPICKSLSSTTSKTNTQTGISNLKVFGLFSFRQLGLSINKLFGSGRSLSFKKLMHKFDDMLLVCRLAIVHSVPKKCVHPPWCSGPLKCTLIPWPRVRFLLYKKWGSVYAKLSAPSATIEMISNGWSIESSIFVLY